MEKCTDSVPYEMDNGDEGEELDPRIKVSLIELFY